MASTFTWVIKTLERTTADGVVHAVNYGIIAEDETGIYRSSAFGTIGLEPPDPDNMVNYADLTPELVIQWVQDKLGEETIGNALMALQTDLDEQRTPTKALGVPWIT